jgi:hypothetical protein
MLSAELLIMRARYYTFLGQYEKAVADYDLCLAHNPEYLEALCFRANLLFAHNFIEVLKKKNFI